MFVLETGLVSQCRHGVSFEEERENMKCMTDPDQTNGAEVGPARSGSSATTSFFCAYI
ncbi:hypothetical protein GW17_00031296 [Ensete ventricosum]|nr:hypothetical protein GW17_00031296 [Ensete ventricosum]